MALRTNHLETGATEMRGGHFRIETKNNLRLLPINNFKILVNKIMNLVIRAPEQMRVSIKWETNLLTVSNLEGEINFKIRAGSLEINKRIVTPMIS